MMNPGEQAVLKSETQPNCPARASAALPVFESIMTGFLNQLETLDKKVSKKLRQSILAQVSLRLSSLKERQRLNAWISGSAERLEIDIRVSDMQNCIHHAYHYACDNFGPIEADELMANAVKQTESMAIALDFPPRELL